MKRAETNFITDLLSNPKLTSDQKNKVFELALRDINKKGADQRILQDLQIIKEKMGIEIQSSVAVGGRKFVKKNGYWTTPVSVEDIKGWDGDVFKNLPVMDEETLKIMTKMGVQKPANERNGIEPKNDTKNLSQNSTIVKTITKEEIEKRLEKVMDPELGLEYKNPKKKNNPTSKNISANPKHVAEFMALFNHREGLKYLTHDYDENKDFEIDKFIISANQVFKEKTKILNIPPSLWRIVKQFAFDSKQTEWTSISEDYKKSVPISIGWATKELRDWSKKNRLHPIRNKEYNKIIDDFKRITRIEYSNFEKLIEITLDGVFKKDIENFDIQKTDLAKADFYSHVGFLKIALETIFEEIKKRSDSPNKKRISLKYERSISDEGYYLRKISITHHNSFANKELKLILKEWQEKGNMGKIKEKLKGYCHWSVETLIEGNPVRVNILRDEETYEYENIEQTPNGFRHIITFYYK